MNTSEGVVIVFSSVELNRRLFLIVLIILIVLVILVQLFQSVGTRLARKSDKRLKQ